MFRPLRESLLRRTRGLVGQYDAAARVEEVVRQWYRSLPVELQETGRQPTLLLFQEGVVHVGFTTPRIFPEIFFFRKHLEDRIAKIMPGRRVRVTFKMSS